MCDIWFVSSFDELIVRGKKCMKSKRSFGVSFWKRQMLVRFLNIELNNPAAECEEIAFLFTAAKFQHGSDSWLVSSCLVLRIEMLACKCKVLVTPMKLIGIFCIKRVCAGRRLPQNVNSTLSSHPSQTQIMILVPSTVNPALRSLKRKNIPSWLIFVWFLHLIKLCRTPVYFLPFYHQDVISSSCQFCLIMKKQNKKRIHWTSDSSWLFATLHPPWPAVKKEVFKCEFGWTFPRRSPYFPPSLDWSCFRRRAMMWSQERDRLCNGSYADD